MTVPSSLQAMAAIAAIVQQAGEIQGRIRIQKMMYLLGALGASEVTDMGFRYHHYGPYSETVADALRQAVAHGVLVEHGESFDEEWQRYSYKAGQAIDAAKGVLSEATVGAVDRLVVASTHLHWRVLELAATAHFLRRAEGLASDSAQERALTLKPACQPYVADARRLIAQLGLE